MNSNSGYHYDSLDNDEFLGSDFSDNSQEARPFVDINYEFSFKGIAAIIAFKFLVGVVLIGSMVFTINDNKNDIDSANANVLSSEIVKEETVIEESDGAINTSGAEDYNVMLANEEQAVAESVEETTEAATEAPKTIPGYTNLGMANVDGYLNVREQPTTESSVVGKIPTNGACEIIQTLDGWYQITSGSVSGYVSAEFIITGDDAYNKALEVQSEVAIVTCDVLNLREQPNTESEIMDQVATGQELEIISKRDDNWVEIKVDDATTGFACTDFVECKVVLPTGFTMQELEVQVEQGITQKRVDICEYAKQFLGNPYVWGGTSLTNGCDCSGFVKGVYEHFGYYLSRTSAAQANNGTRVSLDELKPGDLVFYSNGSRINHVAMYIGNGQIIQAKSEKYGIVISGFDYRSPYCAVRIIND